MPLLVCNFDFPVNTFQLQAALGMTVLHLISIFFYSIMKKIELGVKIVATNLFTINPVF